MSDAYCRIAFPYMAKIMEMLRDMIKSCRRCPLAPCGNKRMAHECRKRLEKHYNIENIGSPPCQK